MESVMNNCFTFTYQFLKNQGFKVPSNLGNLNYEETKNDIIQNYKYYLKNNLHIQFFNGWTEIVTTPQKNDIILHKFGLGIALNKHRFLTMNHKNKIIVRPIRKNCTVRRVNG
jgi:hypothetical protein